ncbi:Uncharacterised protein [Enterobacter hormaechei]|uniref:Uncharacterized protein n=1 Tax=Enterobacter hormaechei TaxID=158836 RepID=A0A822X6K1_9ENTR|nr:Uncharacterised protein [Enterobacter hormaechei]
MDNGNVKRPLSLALGNVDNTHAHWLQIWLGNRPDAIHNRHITGIERFGEGHFGNVFPGLKNIALNDFSFLIQDPDVATSLIQRNRCVESDAVLCERHNAARVAFTSTVFVLDQHRFARHQEGSIQPCRKADNVRFHACGIQQPQTDTMRLATAGTAERNHFGFALAITTHRLLVFDVLDVLLVAVFLVVVGHKSH